MEESNVVSIGNKSYGRRRSLIRIIASLLPDWLFSPPSYLFMNVNFRDDISTIYDYDTDHTNDSYYDLDDKVNAKVAKVNEHSIKDIRSSQPDVICDHYSNKAFNCNLTLKLTEIERQIREIKSDISQFFMIQKTLYETSNTNIESNKQTILAPPPPPLPPSPKVARVIINLKTPLKGDDKIKTPIPMVEILKEMNNVKLRPVQKSPKNKKPRFSTSNRDLQTVLSRRYSAMHITSPLNNNSDKIQEKSENDDSFTEKTV